MRYIAAYLLLQIGGNTSPSASDIKKVLEAVGIEAEDERLDKLLAELEGKDINTVRIAVTLSYYLYLIYFAVDLRGLFQALFRSLRRCWRCFQQRWWCRRRRCCCCRGGQGGEEGRGEGPYHTLTTFAFQCSDYCAL